MLNKISNISLKIALNYMFPLSASPSQMRRRFDWIAGAGAQVFLLRKRFPKSSFIETTMGSIEVEEIQASSSFDRVILYVHGGGYFCGSIHAYRRYLLKLAYRCRAKVICFNYRLAPENPYPAGLDDTIAVYQRYRDKTPGKDFIVGGDSAGGGLSLALLLRLRDEGASLPDRIFCISPWTDMLGTGASIDFNEKNDVWLSRAHQSKWAPWYYGDADPKHPYLSPLNGDYSNCPPILSLVGDQEVLLDDTMVLAEREDCVEAHIGKGMQHDWIISLPWLSESKRASKKLYDFIVSGRKE